MCATGASCVICASKSDNRPGPVPGSTPIHYGRAPTLVGAVINGGPSTNTGAVRRWVFAKAASGGIRTPFIARIPENMTAAVGGSAASRMVVADIVFCAFVWAPRIAVAAENMTAAITGSADSGMIMASAVFRTNFGAAFVAGRSENMTAAIAGSAASRMVVADIVFCTFVGAPRVAVAAENMTAAITGPTDSGVIVACAVFRALFRALLVALGTENMATAIGGSTASRMVMAGGAVVAKGRTAVVAGGVAGLIFRLRADTVRSTFVGAWICACARFGLGSHTTGGGAIRPVRPEAPIAVNGVAGAWVVQASTGIACCTCACVGVHQIGAGTAHTTWISRTVVRIGTGALP